MLGDKNRSPTSQLSVWKAAIALDKVAIEVALRDCEIKRLQAQLENANPLKRRKIAQNPNERFVNLAYILAQANQEPEKRVRKVKSLVPKVVVDEEGSSESEDLGPVRRSGRDRRPTRRYMELDTGINEESE